MLRWAGYKMMLVQVHEPPAAPAIVRVPESDETATVDSVLSQLDAQHADEVHSSAAQAEDAASDALASLSLDEEPADEE